jgi:hypothetical protein
MMSLYHELTSDNVADYEDALDVGDPLIDLIQSRVVLQQAFSVSSGIFGVPSRRAVLEPLSARERSW